MFLSIRTRKYKDSSRGLKITPTTLIPMVSLAAVLKNIFQLNRYHAGVRKDQMISTWELFSFCLMGNFIESISALVHTDV